MSEPQLTLVAELIAQPGKEDQVRQELLSLIEPTRAEPGNVDYFLHESVEKPGHFLFYENWISEQALAEHAQTPYLQRLGTLTPLMLAGEPRLFKLRRIA
ncbi:putative quinol monooxygenase [uncultured Paludibaculum sp.]|uniref:putative quinol monooxygenase n=1 Tax=uncultured Paludibaculum sp. TaxID=1765020 RepID=UPI002AAA7939|nr:putative quinol monooxygenase [uncultured Paludibaculum sp.]